VLEIYGKDEFLGYIGARPYERTKKRKDYRNGSLYKTILTPFGRIGDVNIPRGPFLLRNLVLEFYKMRLGGKPIASFYTCKGTVPANLMR